MDYDFYPAKWPKSKRALVLMGGSGDNKEKFTSLAKRLHAGLPGYSLVTVSFSQMPETKTLKQQGQDLKQLVEILNETKGINQLALMATSMGAYCVCGLLKNQKYAEKIEKVILLDPADYETEENDGAIQDSWSGFEKYEPKGETASDWLQEIKAKVKVLVIHLTLKNHGPNGYIQSRYEDRGRDEEEGFTRLNTIMVKSFYEKLPTINRGKYLEVDNIPHAFVRDGRVQENEQRVVTLVMKLLE